MENGRMVQVADYHKLVADTPHVKSERRNAKREQLDRGETQTRGC